jgi:hypothetical protein
MRAPWKMTFPSAKKAAKEFYDENVDFFENVPDPGDGLRDFLDGMDYRGTRATQTAAGRSALAQRSGGPKMRAVLAMIFAQARPRNNWGAVDWSEVRRLEDALQPYYEPYDTSSPQNPGLYWLPMAAVTEDDLSALSPERADLFYAYQHQREIRELLRKLKSTFETSKKCLTAPQRKHVRARIREWSRWAKDPSKVPAYACEPRSGTGGMVCDYPLIEGELAALRGACRDKYDPYWSELQRGQVGFEEELAPGERGFLPIEAFELEAAPERCTLKEAASVMGRAAARKRQKKGKKTTRKPSVVMGRLV